MSCELLKYVAVLSWLDCHDWIGWNKSNLKYESRSVHNSVFYRFASLLLFLWDKHVITMCHCILLIQHSWSLTIKPFRAIVCSLLRAGPMFVFSWCSRCRCILLIQHSWSLTIKPFRAIVCSLLRAGPMFVFSWCSRCRCILLIQHSWSLTIKPIRAIVCSLLRAGPMFVFSWCSTWAPHQPWPVTPCA